MTFDHVVVSVLGVVTEEERFPEFWREAELLVFVSEEARARVRERYELGGVPTFVLPNSAPEEYFALPSRILPERPRRGCCISNHVPAEVAELEKCGEATGIELDLFGCEGRPIEVTPAFLASYDFVISVGRTVQCCLAAGTPVYCYDQFGGPGFITAATWERHAWHNFSGRSEPVRRSGEELAASLFEQWDGAAADVPALRAAAREHFYQTALFAQLEARLRELCDSPSGGGGGRALAFAWSRGRQSPTACLRRFHPSARHSGGRAEGSMRRARSSTACRVARFTWREGHSVAFYCSGAFCLLQIFEMITICCALSLIIDFLKCEKGTAVKPFRGGEE